MKKKLLSAFLSIIMVAAMLPMTLVSAANARSISIVDGVDGFDVPCLRFEVDNSPTNFLSLLVNLSYDINQIELCDYNGTAITDLSQLTDTATNLTIMGGQFGVQGRNPLTFSVDGVKVQPIGDRVAISFLVYNTAPVTLANSYDGNAVAFLYYKVKDGVTADSNAFRIETDATDGSILSTLWPVVQQRIPIRLSLGRDADGDMEVIDYHGDDNQKTTLDVTTFTYAGWDVEPGPANSFTDKGATVDFVANYTSAVTGNVYVAFYNDGAFVGATTADKVTAATKIEDTVVAPAGDFDSIKVFVWDDAMIAQAPALAIE